MRPIPTRPRVRQWLSTAIVLGTVAACGVGAHAANPGVPIDRLARLARGVNLSHWFWIPHDGSEHGRTAFIRDEDLRALAEVGFTHVRLPIEPGWLWDSRTPDDGTPRANLDRNRLAEVRRQIDRIAAHDLAVIVDVHPARTAWFPRVDDESVVRLEQFWSALAPALADTNPDLVILELLNEPHNFTHQGASWGFDGWKHLRGVPYPATRAELEAVADTLDEQRGREVLRWSASHDAQTNPWNAEAIEARIAGAAAWAKEHGVAIHCGEFGVYRQVAPEAGRGRWLRDVVTALEQHRIGWSLWDYAGGFALLRDGPAAVRLTVIDRPFDTTTIDALRLRAPAAKD